MKFYLVLLGTLFSASLLCAQSVLSTRDKKAVEYYTLADNYRVRGQFDQAISLLNQAIARDKGFVEAYFRLGFTYKMMRDMDRSTQSFEQGLHLTADIKKQKSFFFELGENYLRTGNYEKAIEMLTHYLDNEMMNKAKIDQATLWKRDAQFSIRNRRNVTGFVPQKLSDTVNCFAMQYFPVLTADEQELIFTRRLGAGAEDDEDLVVSKKDTEGRWGKPESISEHVNSDGNEGTCTISADGRQLIFTSCAGRRGYGNCDLFESRKVGDEWSEPINMGPQINSAAWESQPSLSADGRTLYFISDRRSGLGGRDIYVSYQISEGKWSQAESLGPKINTSHDEISPFIHANGRTLFFAANGRPGFGGYDIYRSERENGAWQEPVNFGYPVNNHEDQFSLFITADGQRGFYSHEEGFKNTSGAIYEIKVPEDLQIKFRSNYVKGKVRDKKTSQPLKARVDLYDVVKNELISSVTSDSVTGNYLIVLTQGSDYALYVTRKDYLFQSLNFDYETETNLEPVVVDVFMDRITTGAVAVLKNIFFEFNKYDLQDKSITELERVVNFLKDNSSIQVEISGHTDNTGTPANNLRLSQNRAQSVATYLTTHGIDPGRITQKGYGADRPIKPNDTEENRQGNRRIEFRIIK